MVEIELLGDGMKLERAIEIAVSAHKGQTDKAGQPYILHPLQVMFQCECDAARIVAVLHDVVEDTIWTMDDLRKEGFSRDVLAALDGVTKREGEGYADFFRRGAMNPISRQVKLADLKSNLDLSRIAAPTERDVERMEKYRAAVAMLTQYCDPQGTPTV